MKEENEAEMREQFGSYAGELEKDPEKGEETEKPP